MSKTLKCAFWPSWTSPAVLLCQVAGHYPGGEPPAAPHPGGGDQPAGPATRPGHRATAGPLPPPPPPLPQRGLWEASSPQVSWIGCDLQKVSIPHIKNWCKKFYCFSYRYCGEVSFPKFKAALFSNCLWCRLSEGSNGWAWLPWVVCLRPCPQPRPWSPWAGSTETSRRRQPSRCDEWGKNH